MDKSPNQIDLPFHGAKRVAANVLASKSQLSADRCKKFVIVFFYQDVKKVLAHKQPFSRLPLVNERFLSSSSFKWKSLSVSDTNIERAFTYNETEKSKSLIRFLKGKLRALSQEVRQFLPFFDFIRFCTYIATIDERKERELSIKNEQKLKFFFQERFGNMAKPNKNTVINFSNYKLTPTEDFALFHGLNSCLPPNSVQQEEVFAEFEMLIGQLLHYVPHFSEKFSALKARLSDLAHAYCGYPVDIGNFLILRECIQASRSLR